MIVSGIVAMARNRVIGRKGDLPWHLPDDMKFFMNTTRGHHIITGRVNYESIPLRFRPLKDRVNFVITRNAGYEAPGAIVLSSMEEALKMARKAGEQETFIIGGGEIFKQALEKDLIERLYLTLIDAEVEGDVLFPEIDPSEWQEKNRSSHQADERHAFPFNFIKLDKIR
ncbi:MAG: dihydrofolate reductase [Bacteroidota bacterium]|nr:dihydrofolate reductase [Bacteroidota bacterium]